MSSAGNFHDKEKEDELKKFLDSLNIPKEIAEKVIEQQRYQFQLKKDIDLNANSEKENYDSSDISTSSPDMSASWSTPSHKNLFEQSRQSSPSTKMNYSALGHFVALLVIIGIIVLLVVLVLKYLF